MFQGMKAVKPFVRIINTLKKRPYHAKNGCQAALYGSVFLEMLRAARARMKAMWQPLIQAYVMKPATALMFNSQVKTVPPFVERFKNARRPKADVKATAT